MDAIVKPKALAATSPHGKVQKPIANAVRPLNDNNDFGALFTPQDTNHGFAKLVFNDPLSIRIEPIAGLFKDSGVGKVAEYGVAFVLVSF